MNKILRYVMGLGAVAAMSAGFVACDDVKEDDRFIDMGEVTAGRNVLLVDFTGQACLNCPLAHEVIEDLEEQYGTEHFIPVSVHCGGTLGLSVKRTNFEQNRIGLMTDEGESLMSAFGIASLPRGIINLTGASLDYPQWPAAVRTALEEETDMTINASASFTPTTDENYGQANGISGTIDIKAEILSGEERTDTKVQFWILENGITAQQTQPDKTVDYNYVHNNVFRAQVFAGSGEDIIIPDGTAITATGSIDARFSNRERWMLDNLSVVAYVTGSNGVIQVVRVPVTVPDGYVQPKP